MKTVGIYEAKTHLPRLIKEVAQGETITITKHGVPVARIVPTEKAQHPDPKTAVEALRRYRQEQNIRLGGLSLRAMIEEGRR